MGIRWNAWRRHPRVIPDPQAPVSVSVAVPPLAQPTTVNDISEGGVDLQAGAELAPELVGQAVLLRLRLPESESEAEMELLGRIAHVEGRRLGVVFQNMLPRDRASLRRYVERRSQGSSWLHRLRTLLDS
jgi:hypothetical protein